jgi:transposase InsO family protein
VLVFFAFALDVFSCTIVGWQLAGHMRSELLVDALEMALGRVGRLVQHPAPARRARRRPTRRVEQARQAAACRVGDRVTDA